MANSDGSNFRQSLLFPDHSATSQILSDLTFHLVATGHEVHVITSTQIYDDPDAALPGCENDGKRLCPTLITALRCGRALTNGVSLSASTIRAGD